MTFGQGDAIRVKGGRSVRLMVRARVRYAPCCTAHEWRPPYRAPSPHPAAGRHRPRFGSRPAGGGEPGKSRRVQDQRHGPRAHQHPPRSHTERQRARAAGTRRRPGHAPANTSSAPTSSNAPTPHAH
eukprot:1983126-Prymnesium_polylepis.1